MHSKKLIYFGTPEEAVPPLKSLVERGAEAGYEVALVVTGKDKPRGRGQKISPTPVKVAAQDLGLTVSHEPNDAIGIKANLDTYLGVVVAYGQLIKDDVLAEMPLINMHFSLLPRWRGAAPVERAILAGDEKTGVCLMKLEATLDTGPIYSSAETPIDSRDTTQILKARLVDMGTELLLELLENSEENIEKNNALPDPVPQVGEPVWAEKIQPANLEISVGKIGSPTTDAQQAFRQVRVGGAWTVINGKRLKILDAELLPPLTIFCNMMGEILSGMSVSRDYPIMVLPGGGLTLKKVQLEGKKAMDAKDWYRGAFQKLNTK